MAADNKVRKKDLQPRVKRLKIKQSAVAILEAEMLRRVRAHEGLSRVELARKLKLAPSTVGSYVDRLIEEGFLFERQKAQRNYGRPPTLLGLNPSGGRFIGIDFEAHNILATEVDFSQQPLRQIHETISETDSVEQILCKIEAVIDQLMGKHHRDVLGIGVGVPGIIDPVRQIAMHYRHIRGWENIPLGERLAKRFKVNVYLENNTRSMALAELWFGQARDLDNFVCLGIRTGIAAGVVSARRVLHGKSNEAGRIGDWLCPVGPMQKDSSGTKWDSKGFQSLEAIASRPAVLAAVERALKNDPGNELSKNPVPLTFEAIVAAAEQNNPVVLEVLGNVAQTLAWVICQIDRLFNPQKIILSGSLVALGEKLLDPLKASVRSFCPGHYEPPHVVYSQLGVFNGALGAAALALHEWKPKR